MGTRNYAQVAPTANTIAMNAYIYGYAGHSLVTPHTTIKQLWWTDEKIENKVTRAFVLSKLRGEERGFLDRELEFGGDLTDDTYMEWILTRAKRLFLILSVIGVPDQIFGCIDDSWGDEDLPIPLDTVQTLELSYNNNETLNRTFYDEQFKYLLRELKRGAHIDYGPKEHIPMEYVNTLPPAVSLQVWDRIHYPDRPDDIFMRRKIALTDKETGHGYRDVFMRDVRKAKRLAHHHIAAAWASYTSDDSGYIISNFVPEHTLESFINHRTPTQLMKVPTSKRPQLLCEWMHCLADALASVHHRGVAHTAIRPTNIWIDHNNHIAFADVGSLRSFQRGKKPNKTEAFDYAAPESQICKTPFSIATTPPPPSSMSAFSRLRKFSSSTSSSSGASSGASSTRTSSISASVMSPHTPPSTFRSSSSTTLPSTISQARDMPSSSSSRSNYNFSRHIPHPSGLSSTPLSPHSLQSRFPRPSYIDPDSLRDLPAAAPEMSDIYSLACVYLDILTFLLKGKITDFVKFRTTRVAVPGKAHKYRNDTSFHAEPDRIEAWLDVLEGDSCKHPDPVFRGVPELLNLIRRMMTQNATLRPTALEVRDDLQDMLLGECRIGELCCAGREWLLEEGNGAHHHHHHHHHHSRHLDDTPEDDELDSPFRRRPRDALSIATGIFDPSTAARRAPLRSPSLREDEIKVIPRRDSAPIRPHSSAGTTTAGRSRLWQRSLFRS